MDQPKTMKEKYPEATAFAKLIYNKLSSRTDFGNTVRVVHKDTSTCVFNSALAATHVIEDTTFLFVWTEHMKFHIYVTEDIRSFQQFREIPVAKAAIFAK